MADVDISYNNSVIASLSDSGTEVLETNGTFMADDITVTYTKSVGGNNTMLVNISSAGVMDKTAGEIYDALNAGTALVFKDARNGYFLSLLRADYSSNGYTPYVVVTGTNATYYANSKSAYPTLQGGGGGSND